jgi:[protein-PII] uridylyltransferase
LVLRLLRGEALDAVSRENQVLAHELEGWQRIFLEQGKRGLRTKAEPEERELILARRRDVLRRPAYKGAAPPPTRVEFDNVVSETHTVLDVRTQDRLGLLYVISSVLSDVGLDLSLAKITTEADQAVDVFYVTERDGSKVPEGPRMEEIRRRLTEAISEGIG